MLVEALLEAQGRWGSKTAVADATGALTYKQLTGLALVIRRIVLKETQSQHIGLMLPASTAFPAALFGTLWAGKTAVPLNFLLSPREIADIVADAGVDLILSVRPFTKLTESIPVRTLFLEDLSLKMRVMLGMFQRTPRPPMVNPDDTAVLLYTSGTSGKPKGVELTYRNLHSNAEASIAAAKMEPGHRFLNMLPPFHVFGLTANVLCPIFLAAEVHALTRFSPVAAVKTIEEKQISIVLAIPSMFGAMMRLKSAGAESMRSIYVALSGGEPLPERVAKGFEEKFGVHLLQGYGLTETSPVVSLNAPHSWRDGSVGKPIGGVAVRIAGDDGAVLGTDQDGEICIRGPNVMKGYYRQPDLTATVIDAEGWFHTGDYGRLDGDGFLYITGRKKEMMIVGGENVFPREIEAVLEEHPAVAEAAVIGVTDPSRGEVPVAFVLLKEGSTATDLELRNFAKDRLAGYKVPRQVNIVTEFPRSPTGKILKRELRARVPDS